MDAVRMRERCINHEAGGRLYFTVTGDGKPLRQRRYCFSEPFYAPANAEYYGVAGGEDPSERARRGYDLRRDGKPTQPPCKGSTFKGPFHPPRTLSMCGRMIDGLLDGQ